MLKNHRITFLLVSALFFAFFLFKAITVPITHDETATVVWYSTFSYWEIMMYPDAWPNNHILNTIFTKFWMSIFGSSHLIVRLNNVLSSLIYLYAAFEIVNIYVDKSRFLNKFFLFILFLSNLYLLDFFGVGRGYGISIAFVLLSVMNFLKGFEYDRIKNIWFGFLFAIIASYANFTTLVFLMAANLLVFVYLILSYRNSVNKFFIRLGTLIIVNVLYGLLIMTPIIKMQETNQFQYWTNNGILRDTFLSLGETWWYGSPYFINYRIHFVYIGVLILLLGAIIGGLIILKKNIKQKDYKIIIGIYFVGMCCTISYAQTKILGTPNLTWRTALFLFPLFVVNIASLFSYFEKKKMYLNILSSLGIVILFIHLGGRINLKSVREWKFNEYTLEVINDIKEHKKENNQKATLKTNWLYHPSFHFYTETNKAEFLELHGYDKNIDSNSTASYYYIFKEDLAILEKNYSIIKSYDKGNQLLLYKK